MLVVQIGCPGNCSAVQVARVLKLTHAFESESAQKVHFDFLFMCTD